MPDFSVKVATKYLAVYDGKAAAAASYTHNTVKFMNLFDPRFQRRAHKNQNYPFQKVNSAPILK